MDLIPRLRKALHLICLLPLAAAGCRSLTDELPVWQPRPQPEQPRAARPPLKLDSTSTLGTTDFHPKVSQDQRINVHLTLGRTEEECGNFEAAVSEYEKALDACGHRARLLPRERHVAQQVLARRRLGGALDHLGRFSEAEEHYREAAMLAPNDPKVWNDFGYSQYLQGRWEGAEQCLTRATQLAPNDPRIQTNLGFTLAAAGKTDVALEHLSKAGGSAVGHANLAYLLAALGKPAEAREHYRKALELQPKLALARQGLAKLGGNDKPSQATPLLSARGQTRSSRDTRVQRTSTPPAERPSQEIPWEK